MSRAPRTSADPADLAAILGRLSDKGVRRVSALEVENLMRQSIRHGPVRYERNRQGNNAVAEYTSPRIGFIKPRHETMANVSQGDVFVNPNFELDEGLFIKALEYYYQAARNKLAHQHQAPSSEAVELGIAIAQLISQLQRMVEESGDPDGFDAAHWVARWIKEPLPALGGERPIDVMGTEEGRAQVSKVLAQMQSGAYA